MIIKLKKADKIDGKINVLVRGVAMNPIDHPWWWRR
jgi:ribosomal protein L2